jgi:hypothetical protein
VSQPYKLTAEEARERRDRLCTLEKKFHQSVAELKNAEGMKQQPYASDEALDAAVAAAGLDNMPTAASNLHSASSFAGMNMSSMGMSGMNMSNGMNAMSNGMNAMSNVNDLAGQNSQILDELAFQESMMRLRSQQQQQQQQLEQQQQQHLHHQQQSQQNQQQQHSMHQAQSQNQQQGSGAGSSAAGGSYVDPILGSLALSQNTVNTTPLTASHQYWRRQALLEASSHLDSIRMAQAGAIGIQRPALEPGGLRDLRVPVAGGNGMPGGFNDFDGSSSSMDASTVAALKKRQMAEGGGKMSGPGDNSYNNKRMRRSNDIPPQQDASKFGRFTF